MLEYLEEGQPAGKSALKLFFLTIHDFKCNVRSGRTLESRITAKFWYQSSAYNPGSSKNMECSKHGFCCLEAVLHIKPPKFNHRFSCRVLILSFTSQVFSVSVYSFTWFLNISWYTYTVMEWFITHEESCQNTHQYEITKSWRKRLPKFPPRSWHNCFWTEQEKNRSSHIFSCQRIKWIRNTIKFTSNFKMLYDFKRCNYFSHLNPTNCCLYIEQLC